MLLMIILRFIKWESESGDSPVFLDENDYETLIKSNKLFARKINSTNKLKQMLSLYLRN